MPLLPKAIMGAHHVYPGVNSANRYRQWHAEQIANGKKLYPNMPWGDPCVRHGRPPDLFISGGVARIECVTDDCGEAPAVWLTSEPHIACCIGCGAVYEGIELPARWSEIEAALVRRREAAARYWNPTISVEDLVTQNASGTIKLRPVED